MCRVLARIPTPPMGTTTLPGGFKFVVYSSGITAAALYRVMASPPSTTRSGTTGAMTTSTAGATPSALDDSFRHGFHVKQSKLDLGTSPSVSDTAQSVRACHCLEFSHLDEFVLGRRLTPDMSPPPSLLVGNFAFLNFFSDVRRMVKHVILALASLSSVMCDDAQCPIEWRYLSICFPEVNFAGTPNFLLNVLN